MGRASRPSLASAGMREAGAQGYEPADDHDEVLVESLSSWFHGRTWTEPQGDKHSQALAWEIDNGQAFSPGLFRAQPPNAPSPDGYRSWSNELRATAFFAYQGMEMRPDGSARVTVWKTLSPGRGADLTSLYDEAQERINGCAIEEYSDDAFISEESEIVLSPEGLRMERIDIELSPDEAQRGSSATIFEIERGDDPVIQALGRVEKGSQGAPSYSPGENHSEQVLSALREWAHGGTWTAPEGEEAMALAHEIDNGLRYPFPLLRAQPPYAPEPDGYRGWSEHPGVVALFAYENMEMRPDGGARVTIWRAEGGRGISVRDTMELLGSDEEDPENSEWPEETESEWFVEAEDEVILSPEGLQMERIDIDLSPQEVRQGLLVTMGTEPLLRADDPIMRVLLKQALS